MDKSFDYAIIGGDKRLVYVACMLTQKDFKVITYGMDTNNNDYLIAASLEEAVINSKNIICPIPLTRDNINISSNNPSKNARHDLALDVLARTLDESHSFFAGCIPEFFTEYTKENGTFVYDFMKNEELTIYNTIATAEGAIAEAIKYQPNNLHGSNCLVLGFGRCSKTLSAKLKGLSASVTVCARNKSALAEANTYGYKTLLLSDIEKHIASYDYIFNTVPSAILSDEALTLINKDALLADIAPGGFDFEKSRDLKLNSHLSLGLPGKYSPKSSAEILVDVIIDVKRT